jgi:ATP-dependent helicase HrpA
VVDDDGAVVSSGKDLAALKAPLAGRFREALSEAAAERTSSGQTRWTFGTVERSFTQVRAGHEVQGFPALVDEGSSVGLRVFGSEADQLAAHRLGVRRLVVLTVPFSAGRLTESWDNRRKLTLAGSPYPSVSALLDDCVLAAAGALVDEHPAGLPWDEGAFDALVTDVRPALAARAAAVLDDVVLVLQAWRETDRMLTGSVDLTLLPAMADMRGQVGRLVDRGFVADAGAGRLRHLTRYLAAVRQRRERLDTQAGRDRQLMDLVQPLQEAYLQRLSALPDDRPVTPALERVRWLLEEYRVSLWAQQLGTAEPVSDTRLRKALDAA